MSSQAAALYDPSRFSQLCAYFKFVLISCILIFFRVTRQRTTYACAGIVPIHQTARQALTIYRPGPALSFYEWVITASDDVELAWRRKGWTVSKALHIANRALMVAVPVLSLLSLNSHVRVLSLIRLAQTDLAWPGVRSRSFLRSQPPSSEG